MQEAKPIKADPISLLEAKGDAAIGEVIAELEEEMLAAARNLKFEKAAQLRDQIASIKKQCCPGKR